MKSSVILALVLLVLVAVGHVIRMLFLVELSLDGEPIALWWSAPAAILFGVAAFLLWRDMRTPAPPSGPGGTPTHESERKDALQEEISWKRN